MKIRTKESLEFIKKQVLLILLVILAFIFRFDGNQLPALLGPDSKKYIIPLQIIKSGDFEWLFSQGLNFSPLYRVISYFIQSNSSGGVDLWIPIQQTLGIIETIMFYFISLSLTKGKKFISFCVALIFSLNPLKLYYEHYIMAESLFIFCLVLSIFILLKLLDHLDKTNKLDPLVIFYALLSGISIGTIVLSKEIQILQLTIIAALFIFSLKEVLQQKRFTLLILTLIISLSSFAIELPLMLYNHKKFDRLSVVAVPMQGNLLWALNEEVIRKSKAEPRWLKTKIIQVIDYCKKERGVPLDKNDPISFQKAISLITSAGRYGKLTKHNKGKPLTPEEFSKIGSNYAIETQLQNPLYTLKRIIKSIKTVFFHNNHTFKTFIPSINIRKNSKYELVNTFLPVPYSFSSSLSPKVKDLKLVSTQYLTSNAWYKDSKHEEFYKNGIPIMVDRKTDKAILYTKTSLSIWWMDLLRYIPFGCIVLPLFLLSLLMFFIKKQFIELDLKQYGVLGYALFFFLTISLISPGDARYSLYMVPTMLLFIVSTLKSK